MQQPKRYGSTGRRPMNQRSRERFKGRKVSGAFFRVNVEVLNSAAFCGLSMKARALLLDLGAQFTGYNNGDQSAAWSVMRKRGWKSKDTLRRALLELLEAGLIEQTRQGGLHWCSLFAFTWMGIEECGGKLDAKPNAVPSHLWRSKASKPTLRVVA
ncbi:hypothetical protein [Xanthomonas hortorum]|uniref:hypothetical protein n=2 Tax=Xanthomonas hortorum TaxID=56454 RepID=UPI001F2D2ED4|nr:hypothetical protein [Xanthomonas hortorum]MCE4510320.1 hypothetical protein [Xanthomonas hortorum pv. vitians]MCE4520567.1 hypothetical protein [Xanthomonas hortorum pv. vitians]